MAKRSFLSRPQITEAILKFWDVETGKQFALQKNTQNQLLTTHPNRNLVASFNWWQSHSGSAIWDVGQKTERAQFPVDGSVHSLAFDPCHRSTRPHHRWHHHPNLGHRHPEVGPKKGDAYRRDCPRLPSVRMEKPLPPVIMITPFDFGTSSEELSASDYLDIPQSQMCWLSVPMRRCSLLKVIGMVHIWDVAHGTERVRFQAHCAPSILFSVRTVANLSLPTICTRFRSGISTKENLLVTLQGEDGDGRGIAAKLAISPDGKHLAINRSKHCNSSMELSRPFGGEAYYAAICFG